jgi:hypothetical protein
MKNKILSILAFSMFNPLMNAEVPIPLETSVAVPMGHYFLWLYATWEGGAADVSSATFLPFIYFKNASNEKTASVSFSLTSFEKKDPMEITYFLGKIADGKWTRIKKPFLDGGRLSLSERVPPVPEFDQQSTRRLRLLNATVSAEHRTSMHLIIVAENVEDLKKFYTIPGGSIFRWEPQIILE